MALHGFLFGANAQQNALTELTPVSDETTFIAQNDLMVPDGHTDLCLAYALGVNLDQAEFDSPSLRTLSRVSVPWTDHSIEPTDNLQVPGYLMNIPKVVPGEALNCYVKDSGGAANRKTVALWMADGPIAPVSGQNSRLVRGSATFAAVPYEWSNGQIVLETDLPQGRYAVIGMRVQGTTTIAARLIFPKQGFRSMVLGTDSETQRMDDRFLNGSFGVMGEFQNFVPPRLEAYCAEADAKQDVMLNVVKIG